MIGCGRGACFRNSSRQRFVVVLAVLLAAAAGAGAPPLQAAPGAKEVIAVLDLEAAGATAVEAGGLSDRLREELLRTDRYTLADRSNIEAALQELALQQSGCTTQDCALQVGRFLGVRKMVVGKVTKFNDNLWQVSALMLDVETTQTVRAESVIHEGSLITLLRAGMTDLAHKLATTTPAAETERMARLTVEVEPHDATLLVDNRLWTLEGGRVVRSVEPGRHLVEAKDPGDRFVAQSKIVEVTPGQDLIVSLTLAPKAEAEQKKTPADAVAIRRKCQAEVRFMLHPKHDRFISAVILSSSFGVYALSSFGTTYLVDTKECETKYGLTGGTWEQMRFVAGNPERLAEDFARGGGESSASLAALLGCPAQAAPRVAAAGRRRIQHLLPAPGDEPLGYLRRIKTELARDPALAATCPGLQAPA